MSRKGCRHAPAGLTARDMLCFECTLPECNDKSTSCKWRQAGNGQQWGHSSRDWSQVKAAVRALKPSEKQRFVFGSKQEAELARTTVLHVRARMGYRPCTSVQGNELEVGLVRFEGGRLGIKEAG